MGASDTFARVLLAVVVASLALFAIVGAVLTWRERRLYHPTRYADTPLDRVNRFYFNLDTRRRRKLARRHRVR
jgi:hypothetical protein